MSFGLLSVSLSSGILGQGRLAIDVVAGRALASGGGVLVVSHSADTVAVTLAASVTVVRTLEVESNVVFSFVGGHVIGGFPSYVFLAFYGHLVSDDMFLW